MDGRTDAGRLAADGRLSGSALQTHRMKHAIPSALRCCSYVQRQHTRLGKRREKEQTPKIGAKLASSPLSRRKRRSPISATRLNFLAPAVLSRLSARIKSISRLNEMHAWQKKSLGMPCWTKKWRRVGRKASEDGAPLLPRGN